MKYTLQKLQGDVMARLGEIVRPQCLMSEVQASAGIPCPEDVVALKIRSLLPGVGLKLIREAPLDMLEGGVVGVSRELSMRLMPCGLYAAECLLPDAFLRLTSVKMVGWQHSVSSLILPGSAEWSRQWSPETGIAGCQERPMAYLASSANGRLLRLLGSESEGDALEWLCGWSVPDVDMEGNFDFPEALYGDLIGYISEGV